MNITNESVNIQDKMLKLLENFSDEMSYLLREQSQETQRIQSVEDNKSTRERELVVMHNNLKSVSCRVRATLKAVINNLSTENLKHRDKEDILQEVMKARLLLITEKEVMGKILIECGKV